MAIFYFCPIEQPGMHIILKKIFLLCFVFGAMLCTALAQPKFSAEISPPQVNKDEYVTLRLVIENATDIKNITPPSFKDFLLVSGPNQESGMSNVNGVVNQYIAVSYILQPRHSGKIILPAAMARINGKQYSSGPLKLMVNNKTGAGNQGNASASPFAAIDPFTALVPREDFSDFILKKGEAVQDKVNKNMTLKLQTNKTSCYVGEPILAAYKLFTRLKSESKLTKNPSFNGFSVIDLQRPDVTDYAREKLNGREYNVYTIRKAQLYALQDGTIELESAVLENNIQFLKEDATALQDNVNGFINGFSLGKDDVVTQTVSLSSKPVSITVKALPLAGKPASFNGAVGKFNISATLEKNIFTTDETGKLTLVISGAGNLQLVTPPDIVWPQQLEAFEAKVTDELIQTDVPVSGRKIFDIPFAVQAAGTYQVPAIEFSFFDPATASYKIITTKPITLNVQKGLNKPIVVAGSIVKKEPPSFAKKMFTHRGWIVGAIALMIGLGLLFWIMLDRKKQQRPTLDVTPETVKKEEVADFLNEPDDIPQNPLSLSLNCLNSPDCNQFYSLLNQELKIFLSHKFLISLAELNAKKISGAMDKAGIDNETALQVQQLMQDIEWQLYTPFERNDAMSQLYSRTQSLIQMVHTYHLAIR